MLTFSVRWQRWGLLQDDVKEDRDFKLRTSLTLGGSLSFLPKSGRSVSKLWEYLLSGLIQASSLISDKCLVKCVYCPKVYLI